MAVSVPLLDVYYIELAKQETKKDNEIAKVAVSAGSNLAVSVASLLLPGAGLLRLAMLPLLSMGISLTPDAVKSLKRLVDDNRFYLIKSLDELREYENANGNEWVINSKALKQKQYYIRHPKKLNRNILIEAKTFYDYIEEEQKDELIDYIMAHCSAKHIQIDRTEIVETSGKAKGNVQGADVYGGVNFGKSKGNYYNFTNPNGTTKTQPRENYFWIDKSIMRSIAALTEGSCLTQTYESDLTFGLSVGEAKTIGLDLGKRKKYSYTIHIEC
jgi:hypothetical protein